MDCGSELHISTDSMSEDEYSAVPSTPTPTSPPTIRPPSRAGKRRARTYFSPDDLDKLEEAFIRNKYPDINCREDLACALNVPEARVQTWFQNKRSRTNRQLRFGGAPKNSSGLTQAGKGLDLRSARRLQMNTTRQNAEQQEDDSENRHNDGTHRGTPLTSTPIFKFKSNTKTSPTSVKKTLRFVPFYRDLSPDEEVPATDGTRINTATGASVLKPRQTQAMKASETQDSWPRHFLKRRKMMNPWVAPQSQGQGNKFLCHSSDAQRHISFASPPAGSMPPVSLHQPVTFHPTMSLPVPHPISHLMTPLFVPAMHPFTGFSQPHMLAPVAAANDLKPSGARHNTNAYRSSPSFEDLGFEVKVMGNISRNGVHVKSHGSSSDHIKSRDNCTDRVAHLEVDNLSDIEICN